MTNNTRTVASRNFINIIFEFMFYWKKAIKTVKVYLWCGLIIKAFQFCANFSFLGFGIFQIFLLSQNLCNIQPLPLIPNFNFKIDFASIPMLWCLKYTLKFDQPHLDPSIRGSPKFRKRAKSTFLSGECFETTLGGKDSKTIHSL